ncbi:M-phase inducer phosphatase 1 [Mytilus galloprovincialis]|uniref:M-phase inducer phosphatase n=1 Tax=Mytilus galloprovincialis TaxID=29158 RepID=A0A8B6CMJ2_MYTGA|nr:M-phase inducer phosphatase 1 [Mytilus galloprovincialis]
MLSRRLFDTCDDFDVIPASISSLSFDSTPVKADDLMSVMTPNIKRSLFRVDDEDSGLGMDDHITCTPSLKKSAKRQREEDDNITCSKRPKVCTDIKAVVTKLEENEDLIADGSRLYTLPTVTGKHTDLKSITPQTLTDVLNGGYDDVISDYKIIDCRYPYEFEGGHIRGAENMYLHETILTLLRQPTKDRQIIIFHCEFSSERGPKMLRFLRSKDRELNKENYPSLNFPEIYLLDNGYKAFFNEEADLCDPVSYRPMLHSDHSEDLRHFRVKSKSWTAGEKRRYVKRSMRF